MEHRNEVALFVDFENIRESIRSTYGTEIQPALLMEKARKYGFVHIARAYADFDGMSDEVQRELRVAGLTPVHAASHVVGDRRRSAADLDLLIDLIETLLDRATIPTVMIMSGDRDFLRLVTMARNRFGKEVVLSGVPGTVSADLIDAAGGNFDPLEIPGMERRQAEAAASAYGANGGVASRETAPAPRRDDAGRGRYERSPRSGPAPEKSERTGRPERGEHPERTGRTERTERTERVERSERTERTATTGGVRNGRSERPAEREMTYGRRPMRTTRPQPDVAPPPAPAKAGLPQPDVAPEVASQETEGEGESVQNWQRGKLAERAEAIQKMMNERRANGEPLPAGWGGEVNWKSGDIVEGIVKSITDFGAFLEIGSVDALLHVSQMAWQHVRHPSQIVQVGDKIRVQVLEMDESTGRVSVGLKQLTPDPWISATARYQVGHRAHGRVSGVKEYGVFVELEPGIFGLLHISNIFAQPWGHHPSELYRLDQEVEIMVAKLDTEMRRLAFVLPDSDAAKTLESSTPEPVTAGKSPEDDAEAAETALRFMEGEDTGE